MVGTADMSDINRLENLMGDDLDPKWNEPASRGDLRLLAIRIDTKFDQFRVELTRTTYRAGMIFSGAVITANLAMLGIFATLVR